ncbi:hypothetical protein [Pantoea ananatis]|uniref:hypothetical protein n=1 Tax=Pantoea ananas TaxID=553 RepID=UPI001F0C0C24|nr:hypothetical protein [Pantoea ananatis]
MNITVNRIGAAILRNIQLSCFPACELLMLSSSQKPGSERIHSIHHPGSTQRIFTINFLTDFNSLSQRLQVHVEGVENYFCFITAADLGFML